MGLTVSIVVPAAAAIFAASPIFAVIESVVFGFITLIFIVFRNIDRYLVHEMSCFIFTLYTISMVLE